MAESIGGVEDEAEVPTCRECGMPWLPYWGHAPGCALGQMLLGEVLAMQVRKPSSFVITVL